MIKSLLLSMFLVFGFSTTAFGHGHEAKADGMKKATEATAKIETTKKEEADAALKKVEKMTKEARAKTGTNKKDDKKTK